MRSYVRWVGIAGAIIVALGGLWAAQRLYSASGTNPSIGAPASAPATAGSAAPRSVEVVKPQRATMSRKLDVPASIEAYERAELYAKAAGYISDVYVDIGDHVTTGQVLAVIDVPETTRELEEAQAQHAAKGAALHAAQAHIVQAERMLDMNRSQRSRYQAELALKQATFARREELFAGKAIPQEQLDEARNLLEAARADVRIAEAKIAAAEADVASAEAARAVASAEVQVAAARVARIDSLMQYARIVAPFDGVVSARMVDRGALAQAATTTRTTPLFTIERIDRVRIFIEVPESDIAHVQAGMPAKVKPYGLTDAELMGAVARIASSLKSGTRTMRAEIDLPNGDGRLMHGMYAQVVLELDQRVAALTIPAAALLTEGGEAYVYTVRNEQAIRTPIKTGLDDGIRIQVTQGLEDDALVVVTGKGLITAGAPVRAVLRGGTSG